ncbi:MAG: hypothetical protein ACOVNP_02375 [Flavobacterium sp.]
MNTIIELEEWMLNNNIKYTFTPKHRYLTDIGEGLENLNGLYVWYSIDEKGNRSDIQFFKSEKEAVQFVFEYLVKNEKQIQPLNK